MNTFEEWNRVISNAISLTEVLAKAFDLTEPDDVEWVYVNEDKELVTKTFPNLRKVIDELTEDLYTHAPLYTVNTIADLRKLDYPYDKVYVKGYYDPNDNIFGSNFYVWYPDNTDPDDKGLTIKLDKYDVGRYKLVFGYPIVIGWFGITKDNYDENFVKLIVDKYKKVYDNITNTLYDDTIRKTDSLSMNKLEIVNDDSKFELINNLTVDKNHNVSDITYTRPTIFGLIDIENPQEGDICHVASYYGNDNISGIYVYKENVTRTMHDGGRYISPARLPSNWWNYNVDEDKGCWVKLTSNSYASLEEYGAIKDDETKDNRTIIEAILRNNKHIYIPKGRWRTSLGIDVNVDNEQYTEISIIGDGEESVLEVNGSDGIYANDGVNIKTDIRNIKLEVSSGYKGISIPYNLINSNIDNVTIISDHNALYILNAINSKLTNLRMYSKTDDACVILNSSNLSLINCVGKTDNTNNTIYNIREQATMINCGSWLDYNESTDITDNNAKGNIWGIFGYVDESKDIRYNVTLINCDIDNFISYGLRFVNDGRALLINNTFRSIPNTTYYASICVDQCTELFQMINNKFDTELSTRAKKSEICAMNLINVEGIDEIDVDNVLYKTSNKISYKNADKYINYLGYNNLYVDNLVGNNVDINNLKITTLEKDDASDSIDSVSDLIWSNDNTGPILIDRNDGKKYRLFVDSGNLGLEEV